jgi:CubicO group peptidase (beta-lactamase class C family)
MLPARTNAQAANDTLYSILKQKDSLLFNTGFNNCNIQVFENLLSDNFEFYHDEGGATCSKTKFIADFKQNVCGLNYKAKRMLDPGSLQVYPLFKNNILYGAVQTGTHSFYGIEKDKPEYLTSVARFTNVWVLENGSWKLKRSISYDHHDKAILPDFENATAINAWLKANKIPALAIGIIRDSVLQEIKVFGELDKGRPAAYNSIHNVASITKLITTMTILRLVSAGKWNLDEPLYHYWIDADIANDPRSKTLTTRNILNQQSGFPNWRYELPGKKLAFINTPGTKYGYSGEGFEYLRHALEKKFNKPFDVLANEILLKPLGMTDSKLIWDDAMMDRFAIPHNAAGEALEVNKNTKANGADLFKTTVPDLAKFLIATLHNEGLSKDVATQMIAHTTKTKENRYVGLGWFVYDMDNGEYAISHGGDDAGSHSICFLLPKTGDGLIIFANSDNAPSKIYSDIIQAYLGEKGKTIIDIELK